MPELMVHLRYTGTLLGHALNWGEKERKKEKAHRLCAGEM